MTASLFDHLPRTRKRRVMMHVVDAGPGAVQLKCRRCGHDTGWVLWRPELTISDYKRGLPCPNCNQENEHDTR